MKGYFRSPLILNVPALKTELSKLRLKIKSDKEDINPINTITLNTKKKFLLNLKLEINKGDEM